MASPRLERMLPWVWVALGLSALVSLIAGAWQLSDRLGLSAWLGEHVWDVAFFVGGLAALAWIMVLLGVLRRRNRLPRFLTERKWLMDVLDRLTNRAELERRLNREVTAIFVDAAEIGASLKSKVIGQNQICDDLAAQIRRRLALTQRDKPVGVFLFAGPPGSGKTWLGKVVAGALHRKLLHFDMTQFSAPGFGATSLFGAPKGYVGSKDYGKLTAGLRDIPDAVVLLDEFEKASGDVHKNFLTAWNDGFVTEASDGKQISTTRALFVLTTNAAVDELAVLAKQYANDHDQLRRAAVDALRTSGFAPEVLNRIDRIFVFSPLSGLDIARVGALEIERMIEGYGLKVAPGGIDPQVLLDLMDRQRGVGTEASSRDLTRAIEEAIADSLITAKQQGATEVALVRRADGVVAEPRSSLAPLEG